MADYPGATWDGNTQDTGNDWAGANPDQYANAADHNEMAAEVVAVEDDLRNTGVFITGKTDIDAPLAGADQIPVYDTGTGLKKVLAADLVGLTAYKTDDVQVVNNSVVLVDDDALTFAIGASEEWAFEIWGFYTTAAAADFKCSMNADQACTKIIAQVWLNGAYQGNITAYEGTVALDAGALTAAPLHIIGTIENAGSAATVVMRWAQNNADASDTEVLQGSFLRARRLS